MEKTYVIKISMEVTAPDQETAIQFAVDDIIETYQAGTLEVNVKIKEN